MTSLSHRCHPISWLLNVRWVWRVKHIASNCKIYFLNKRLSVSCAAVAPLCFLYNEPSKLYSVFREMYIRYFFRLHSISSHPSVSISVCMCDVTWLIAFVSVCSGWWLSLSSANLYVCFLGYSVSVLAVWEVTADPSSSTVLPSTRDWSTTVSSQCRLLYLLNQFFFCFFF